jgi:OmpA-OmpF porin, OOP family
MRLSIYDLRRDGPYVVLDFGITCLTTSGCSQELDFAAPAHSGTAVYANANRPSGLMLVDPVGQKEYLPVRDSQNRPFTSELPSLADSLTHLAWVVFPAPPASVSSIDVVFPLGGPQVPAVPISSSASPPVASANVTAAQPAPFAAPLGSTATTGLTLPVKNLVDTVGNPSGSDSESATQATVTLRSDVLFHFAKSNLTPTAHTILAHVAPQIKARAIGPVSVTGYTDSIGTDAVNIPLSHARAAAVVAALQPLTPGITYKSQGLGSADPVAPNTKPDGTDNPAGRALNRRVTIVFAVKAPSPPAPPPSAPAAATGQTGQSGPLSFVVNSGGETTHYQFTMDGMFREGDLVVLRMTLDCLSVKGQVAGNSCDGETDLGGTNTVPPQTENDAVVELNSLSALYLRDPATGNEYIPLHDTDGTPLTSGVDGNITVGDAYPEWIYFPAPPSSVSALTVVAPGGSSQVADVPISASPPAQP